MQDPLRYGAGIDVGTTHIRCVVGYLDSTTLKPNIVGVGAVPNTGMRKGQVVNIVSTAEAIDKALEEAERMSGHQVHAATVSVNGNHITAMSSRGVVAVNSENQEISDEDLARAEQAATVVQLPANREILQITPRSYQLDGQENIKDPRGMSGVRLELDAHVITALSPHLKNLVKSVEMTETKPQRVIVAGLAAASAVLSTQQKENGVVLVDLGGTTTNIVVFEEGDLQHVAILPLGSINITNDLAIGLRTDLDVAEKIKLKHAAVAAAEPPSEPTSKSEPKTAKAQKEAKAEASKTAAAATPVKSVTVEHGSEKISFDQADITMIVEARLEEIFELIDQELKQIGRSGKLPGGVVLTGGGAAMSGIADYAKQKLRLPARIAKPAHDFSGMHLQVAKPEFATAVGLMMLDFENTGDGQGRHDAKPGSGLMGTGSALATGIFDRARGIAKRFK